jgi:hypothetical protein
VTDPTGPLERLLGSGLAGVPEPVAINADEISIARVYDYCL